MTNKNEAWRLEDENGKKVGKESSGDIKMFFDGKEVGSMQSISFTNGSSIRPYTIGTLRGPDSWSTYGTTHQLTETMREQLESQRSRTFVQAYLGNWTDTDSEWINQDAPPAPIRTRTVEMQLPNIEEIMWREMTAYEERMGDRPEYLSLNKIAYESFYIGARRYDMPSLSLSITRFRGIEVMCNPLQEHHVLALGGPELEMQRSLYYEQS